MARSVVRCQMVVVIAAAVSFVGAQELPPLTAVSPTWVGHLRPQGLELSAPELRGWTIEVSAAYGNTFLVDPGLVEAHVAIDGAGSSLSPAALSAARVQWPDRDLYAIDAESLRFTFEAAYTGVRWFGGVRLPAWAFQGTAIDGWPTAVHELIGVNNYGRDVFPEGQTLIALLPAGGAQWVVDGDQGLGIVALSGWAGRRWALGGDRGNQRLWLTVSAPVGGTGPWGDRGWCLGPRWSIGRRWRHVRVAGGAGWTFQGGNAGTLGKAADTAHAWAGVDVPLGRGWDAMAMVRFDGSVFADVHELLGRDTAEMAIGLAVPLGAGLRLHLAVGEDFPRAGLAPDFSIQSAVIWRP